jgi:small conductance mechanosensitive channel
MNLPDIAEKWANIRAASPAFFDMGLSIANAFLILVMGIFVARTLRKKFRKSSFGGHRIDATLRPVMGSIIFYLVLALTLYAFLTKLGIPATALLAVFGSAGLAIGLALKDTLSNIAAGFMLIFLRPLEVGDFVETSNFSGSVKEIGLFSTTLINSDGLYIYVPNGQVWNNRLQNYGRHKARRFSINISVGYDTDLKAAQKIMLGVLSKTPNVLNEPAEPQCYVTDFGEYAIAMTARCWLPASDWSAATSDIRIALKEALDTAKIEIPYPQRVVIQK